jgi:hypothetical protein
MKTYTIWKAYTSILKTAMALLTMLTMLTICFEVTHAQEKRGRMGTPTVRTEANLQIVEPTLAPEASAALDKIIPSQNSFHYYEKTLRCVGKRQTLHL